MQEKIITFKFSMITISKMFKSQFFDSRIAEEQNFNLKLDEHTILETNLQIQATAVVAPRIQPVTITKKKKRE